MKKAEAVSKVWVLKSESKCSNALDFAASKQADNINMIIIIIDIVTIIHLCPHPPLILIGDSQSFQTRPLDGAARTHLQIPLLSCF